MSSLVVLAAIGWKVIDRFHFGSSFAVSPHGLGIAVGYLAGAYVLLHEAPKHGVREDHANTMVFWALIGAVVGARVFYVIGHFSEFNGIGEMLALYQGGISLIGGIFGAVIFAYPFMRRFRYGFLQAMDTAAIGLPLGIVIGRIGDLVIGDHLGKPTSWALAFRYRGGNLSGYACDAAQRVCSINLSRGLSEVVTRTGASLCRGQASLCAGSRVLEHGVGVHQTALYDFVSTMVLVSLLIWMARVPRRTGVLFLTFATWYGAVRVITDFLRIDKQFFGLTGSQWASLAVILACGATLLWFAAHPLRESEPVEADPPGPEGLGPAPAADEPVEADPPVRADGPAPPG
jgi:phosphatidylglycerol---prolipoprotein diacylglyceryl transferase